MSGEPYGTTPLPAKRVAISYNPGQVWDVAQQPKSQQIAAYEGLKTDNAVNGATVLDVNQHFVIYAVKKGLIRILHRHSTLRTLFRGHEGQVVSDIQIFLDGDVLGSVGSSNGSSTVIIWRVFERTPEIMCEKLLEITTSAYSISRLIWHPFNPNQFWIVHTVSKGNGDAGDSKRVASLVDTTRISTLPHETEQHAVCMFFDQSTIMDGVVELSQASATSLTDLDWSEKDVRHVLTVHQGGEVRLWDLRKLDNASTESTMLPACLCLVQEDSPLSRCKFLPHECPSDKPTIRETALTNCFLTASSNNSAVTLWSPFEEHGRPTKLQVFGLETPSSSYLLDICYGPSPPDGPAPSLFVLLADQTDGKLFSWHLRSEWKDQTVVSLVGCDYVVPFVTSFPMYSWSTQVHPAADISEDELTDQGGLVFDMKLFSYQSTVVQCLILTSFMCLPPGCQWSPATVGVTVVDLQQESGSATQSQGELAISEDFEGEDYDIGEDDVADNDDDFNEAPAASSLPVPDGLDSPKKAAEDVAVTSSGGAFANWLGALAIKAPGPAPIPPAVVAASAEPPQAISTTTTMFTPADLFPNNPLLQPKAAVAPESGTGSADNKKNKGRNGRSRSPNQTKGAAAQRNGDKKGKSQTPQRHNQNQSHPETNYSILQRNEETANVLAPAVAPLGKTLSTNSISKDDLQEITKQQESTIREAVRSEMKSSLIPLMDQRIRDCVNQSIEPILESIDRLGKDGVQVDNDKLAEVITQKIDGSLRVVFAEKMQNVMIPAFESVSKQMFVQISSTLEDGLAKKDFAADSNEDLGGIKGQLSALNQLVTQLSAEVVNLRSMISKQGANVAALPSPPVTGAATAAAEQQKLLEQQVLALLGQRQYEAAFTKALSASTVEMALFACRNADLGDVLGGNSPALSQPILLCLMHQLGTSVVTATDDSNILQMELAWLQEVSLSINPSDESMKRHLPAVLQQLVAGINDKMARTEQPAMRRNLQRLLQVLRGVQV